MFGGVTITPDLPLKTLSAPDNGTEMQWPAAVGANPLWSHPAVPCAVDATGVKIDPACQDVPAYDAPQQPAIAIVDTGIDPTKAADFGSRIVASVDFSSLSPAGATGDQMGHGTMVAGIAAGASSYAPGVAQNAPLVDVRTGDAQGESLTSDVIAALDWIDANKATYNIRVANMSMAGNQATSFRNDPLDKAVEQLWLNGVVVVAAVGNNGNADGTPSPIGAPANDPFVITVGGTDQAGTVTPADDTRAPWSAYGRTIDGFQKPEISAPARYMVAPVPMDSLLATTEPSRVIAPGYMWMSGTSFAAPQVSGAAAEILAEHPTWTPDQVKGALMVTATQTADTTGGTGVGELNAVAAVKGVATPPNPNLHLNDFVGVSATTGENVFDADAWATYAKANPAGPRPTTPRPTGPCPTGPCPTGPCPTGPCPTGPCPTGPCPTGPCPTGPCPTGPCPTGPCPTGPCPTGRSPTGPCPTGPCRPGRCPKRRPRPHGTTESCSGGGLRAAIAAARTVLLSNPSTTHVNQGGAMRPPRLNRKQQHQ